MANEHKYCPECGKYWRTSNIYSNTYARVEEYSCENAHRWSRSLRFDGYAADGTRCYTTAGTRCYTTAPLTKPTLKG